MMYIFTHPTCSNAIVVSGQSNEAEARAELFHFLDDVQPELALESKGWQVTACKALVTI